MLQLVGLLNNDLNKRSDMLQLVGIIQIFINSGIVVVEATS
jgi:hypothetical protein